MKEDEEDEEDDPLRSATRQNQTDLEVLGDWITVSRARSRAQEAMYYEE